MTETHERHIVFTNDLSEGVSAVAKAIARRQARDAAFPNAACANEILYVCQEAERRIPDVDMAPISSLMLNVPLGSIRDDHPSDHDRLATLCELSLGAHLVRPYSRQEEVAVARLFAALHLAFSDEPLPIANYAAHGIAGGDIVGCGDCIASYSSRTAQTALAAFLGVAVRDGLLDPNYAEPHIDEPRTISMALAGALARYVPEFARLAWRTSSAATAQALETDLTRKGFAVALDRSHGRVVAQKRMVANDIHFAMKWGAQYSVGRADWLGAETVYTEDRALDDHWA